ncbi:ATP-binding protein [Brevundimonas sp. FT23028]|uniref:ATP-binding protein n=1 Tax=Brevundimonas sp. FT23028 TaxID=3393748 RepID=UPI003B5869F4
MSATAYALVSQVRFRELKTRVGLAAFIGMTAWFFLPSVWPIIWFLAVLLSQLVDWAVFRRFRRDPEREPGPAYVVLCCAVTVLGVAIYSGIAAWLWINGGEIGRAFALVQVAGGLLHVSLHMHHVRPILFAAVATHGAYFLGLPVVSALLTGRWQELLIALGCLLYMSHLVVAVRQANTTTRLLRSAKELEQNAREKAEEASAAKSDFLAVISHEIRTPMNAVISAANLLRRTDLDERQAEHVSMLTDAGEVMMGLLNDVLDVSKIEAGKMVLETDDVDVRARLTSLARLWEPRAAANGVQLVVEASAGVPDCVRTDPLRFQQILFNLISNAVKFTEAGRIAVSVGWREGVMTVDVADTGCGIPAARLAHVFDSFEQAEAGTTRRYGGTGLGLSISRKLAELMGGGLTVASIEGEGATFTLVLPMQVSEVRPVALDAIEAEVGGLQGRSILAADDHEVNRRILTLLLEPHGCRLTLVENGAEAVEAARVERFDAILMDMQMPVMDGLEATRRIRGGEGLNGDTAVVALTANALDIHRQAWEAAGVAGFLTKPIDPSMLIMTLADACASAGTAQARAQVA